MPLDTKRLTKHFDKLTPRERFALMVTAFQRGDKTEHQLLIRTSPREMFSIPTFRGYSEGFRELADFYVICQLETGIGIATGVATTLDEEKAADLERMIPLRMLAHRFIIWREAWQRLCNNYGIDWPSYLSMHPAATTIKHLENLASGLDLSPEVAQAVLHRGDDEAEVITGDELYEFLKERMEQRVAAWM